VSDGIWARVNNVWQWQWGACFDFHSVDGLMVRNIHNENLTPVVVFYFETTVISAFDR
jgi:hypothetical protein